MGADQVDASKGALRPGEPDAADVLSLILPSVLDGLAAEGHRSRVSAAWTACRLADERPELGAELADRLVRSADRTPREPLVRTLSSLHERHPESVGDALRAFDGTVVRAVRRADSWDFDAELRADGGGAAVADHQRVVDADAPGVTVYQRQMPDEPTSRDTSSPGSETSSSVDAGVEPSGVDAAGSTDTDRAETTTVEGARKGDPANTDRAETAPVAGTATTESDGADVPDTAVERRRRIQAAENSESFAAVQLVSDFDEVSVVDPPRRGRYGHVLPSRGRIDQAEYGVDLLFFDEPGAETRSFGSTMAKRLRQWYCADEASGIAAVADYGDHPRPWVATPRAETTLADRDPSALGVALRDARELAAGLVAAHERGLVHGGIDPHDVVYPATGFSSEPAPSLSHLGVMTVFRKYFGPAEYVDPRYAAPEYFDDNYGDVDHATDVYHLGAVLFRLFTGEPPYDGDYEVVRESILADGTPCPSDVRPEIPEAVDEVIAKAMAPRKLTRYEAATQLSQSLDRLG
ncbi:protein kinase family protein [Halorhabdus amylolytica]|uniref:serine/threonine protein kinase n=1 Tax=Halorhabdus amylolytica TaxID=2559573 RepID=UPI0010AA7FC7|nr:serine/threonine protein kinase [Halorhabdus amylolytica]